MSISSISDTYLTGIYASLLSKTGAATSSNTTTSTDTDYISLSDEATKLPSPPEQMDFANITKASRSTFFTEGAP